MARIITFAAALSAALLSPPGVPRAAHVVAISEGAAHEKADARCRALGQRARVHLYLNSALAFECFDPSTGAGEPPPSLTYGPL
jgi:hypothetical protein